MTPRSRRAGAFWSFIFGVAFGATLGAVLTHKFLTASPTSATAQPAPPAAANPAPEPQPESSDPIARKLREWRLTPEDIRLQLERAGKAIRREGTALGDRLDEATLDARIVTLIKAKFALDSHLSAREITVSSRQGHVTLSGEIDSPDSVVRAVVLALDTPGVADVASELRVRNPAARL